MSAAIRTCRAGVYREGFRYSEACGKPGKVVRDGVSYCTVHDPERVEARREARFAKYDERASLRKAAEAKAAAWNMIAEAAVRWSNIPVDHELERCAALFELTERICDWERLP